jgi:SagB-type dehydrogenase family enzyme
MTPRGGGEPLTMLRLRRDAELSVPPDAPDALRVLYPLGELPFPQKSPGMRTALTVLADGDVSEADLAALVVAGAGAAGLLQLHSLLRKLTMTGLLEHAVYVDGEPLARLVPLGRGLPSRPRRLDDDALLKLSRHAIVRAEGGVLVAQAPRSHFQVELSPPTMELVARLADWTPAKQLLADVTGLQEEALVQVLGLCVQAELLATRGPEEEDPEEATLAQGQWSLPDLWQHARSRGTGLSTGFGGTYRFRDRFAALPAVPEPGPGVRVDLPVPSFTEIAAKDPSFTEVLEQRRSIREHDADSPITLAQLGELLFRTARVRAVMESPDGQDVLDTPTPGGGAVHEIEIYPMVTDCAGLAPGLWHYRSGDHALELVAEPGPATAALVAGARATCLMDADPQVVLILAARFGRAAWKYESMSYALTLKHVGVHYQTFYLVGTAMGLGVCGLGAGDAGDFALASGLDYYETGSVGELVVGSRPPHLQDNAMTFTPMTRPQP